VSVTAAITIAIGGTVAITESLGGSGSGGKSLSVQVKVDLNNALRELAALGFHIPVRSHSSSTPSPSNARTDCARSATGEVRRFLAHYHQCKDASVVWTTSGHGVTTRVVISLVVMPTRHLAGAYKKLADTPYKSRMPHPGNPPGEPRAFFDGNCYASGENGATVWTEQVQPTGQVKIDQEILKRAAPAKLSPGYLKIHCVE
jgi:hypothetical protein